MEKQDHIATISAIAALMLNLFYMWFDMEYLKYPMILLSGIGMCIVLFKKKKIKKWNG
jgi:hypothetical protein